ncbi:hypothetical protein [Gillisia limnaea]|uniref:Membrane or secreted protein n=1 Tax=Gillisia limnaea (strain DSM 15749 / LMG 21470 / R-8282) TaxID=865937 RepID=H2BRR5_GILLR|nr:hypothetical protein [Gillisia limnaea]EHQ01380.1 membrane or secreted protein [Gillisia limnaea DSM 15749]
MKKLLLLPFIGLCLTACSVDPIEDQIIGENINEVNAALVDYGCAGPDNSMTITYSEAAAIESWDEVRKLYLSLLAPGVLRNGTFDPSIWDLINRFQDQGLGDYTSEYTIVDGECTDSVLLTFTVVPDGQSEPPCEPVDAGPDNSMTITFSEAAAIESWDEVRKLYLSLLAPGVVRNGIFDPSIWDLINRFNDQENGGPGDYSTEYTIGDGECTDSVLLTVTVIPDEQSNPACAHVNAGPDKSITMTKSQAAAIESWDEVRKLYLSLLAPGVVRNGTFDPSIWDLINRFNDQENGGPGDYTTEYTIVDGECSDSVLLTITVIPD